VGASFRFFASNAALYQLPLNPGKTGSSIKACNQKEEFGSRLNSVSSFTYNTPLYLVRIFLLL